VPVTALLLTPPPSPAAAAPVISTTAILRIRIGRPDNPQHNIEDHTFARLIDDLASDETSYQAQNQSADNRHGHAPSSLSRLRSAGDTGY
jgi:hypothetical protein